MVPPEAKNIFGKPHVQYYKNSTPIVDDGNTLYLQECDIYKSFTSKGLKTISRGYIYVKDGKIIASKMINAKDNVIEDLAIMDEKGHIQKVFGNHARGKYFNELVIYKDEDVVQRKPIHIPLESAVAQLKRIE